MFQGEASKWPHPGRWRPLAGGLATNARIRVAKGSDFDQSIYCIFQKLTKTEGQLPVNVVKALELHPQALWTREVGPLSMEAASGPVHHDEEFDLVVPEQALDGQQQRSKRTRSLRMNARGTHKHDHTFKRQKKGD